MLDDLVRVPERAPDKQALALVSLVPKAPLLTIAECDKEQQRFKQLFETYVVVDIRVTPVIKKCFFIHFLRLFGPSKSELVFYKTKYFTLFKAIPIHFD